MEKEYNNIYALSKKIVNEKDILNFLYSHRKEIN